MTPTQFRNLNPDLRLVTYVNIWSEVPRSLAQLASGTPSEVRSGEWVALPAGGLGKVEEVALGRATVQEYRCTPHTLALTPTTNIRKLTRAETSAVVRTAVTHPPLGVGEQERPQGGLLELRHRQRCALPPTLVALAPSATPHTSDLCFTPTKAPAARAVPMTGVTQKQLNRLHTQQAYTVPRAWDVADPQQHYGSLYADGDRTKAMARIAQAAAHPVLTAQLADAVRLTYLSGHSASKPRKGVRPASLEHSVHECQKRLWKEALGCWEKLTGEKLDHTDVRHTLLGDRQAGTGALPLGTHEEVFRALHASILQTALENWKDQSQKRGGRRRDTKSSLQRVDTILKKLITRRWKQLRRQGKDVEFADTWILTGAARWHKGEPNPTLLALRHIPPPTADSTVIASGDGAGPVQGEKRKAAGWGGIVVAPAHPQRGAAQAYLLAGPVATDQSHPLYLGAVNATNNAGEILAMTRMLEAASAIALPGEHIEVQSDSMCAILAALGARPGTTRAGRRCAKKCKSNDAIKRRLRQAYAATRRKAGPGRLTIRKVKGHSSHVFNEVADELAAIGRATDTSSDELPQSTAELSDRFGRALQAIGDAELADWQGFELMQT